MGNEALSTGKQDGRTRVVIQLWRKWQPIYTRIRGSWQGCKLTLNRSYAPYPTGVPPLKTPPPSHYLDHDSPGPFPLESRHKPVLWAERKRGAGRNFSASRVGSR